MIIQSSTLKIVNIFTRLFHFISAYLLFNALISLLPALCNYLRSLFFFFVSFDRSYEYEFFLHQPTFICIF